MYVLGRPRGLGRPEDYERVGRYSINQVKFNNSLEPEGECLVWTAGRHRQGYGMVSIYDNQRQDRVMTVAHRAAMMLHLGRELTRDEFVVHNIECSNPLCCRIEHLTLGDAVERNRVSYARGNAPKTRHKVNAVKKQQRNYRHTDAELRLQRDGTTAEIAQHFGVTKSEACKMRYRVRKGYKWLD